MNTRYFKVINPENKTELLYIFDGSVSVIYKKDGSVIKSFGYSRSQYESGLNHGFIEEVSEEEAVLLI